ncbi:DUF4381 domain-containing protein [Aeromonas sanarellii]|uniref:DUF4381 domain-containing protein n=1 Tax=Aeromonas sanarellii TaxID=633415 RepID=UPI0038D233A9
MPSVLNAAPGSGPTSPSTPLQGIQAQLRDIHPGPSLETELDPRLPALGWLLIAAIAAWLIWATVLTLWRQRRWARQIEWQADDLVPRLHETLREAAMARWPEAASLQGEDWLAWLDEKGGGDFGQFASQWPRWLYGSQRPDEGQRARLRRAYLSWGRRCVSRPGLPLLRRDAGRARRVP